MQLLQRMADTSWVLNYLGDLDADFLSLYGIDLEEQEVSGPRFFALAYRTSAYQGAIAARIEAEREAAQAGGGTSEQPREVPAEQLGAAMPGWVERVEV